MDIDHQLIFSFQALQRDFRTERAIDYLQHLVMLVTSKDSPIDLTAFSNEMVRMQRIIDTERAFQKSGGAA